MNFEELDLKKIKDNIIILEINIVHHLKEVIRLEAEIQIKLKELKLIINKGD